MGSQHLSIAEQRPRLTCLISNRRAYAVGPESPDSEAAGLQLDVIGLAARAGCSMVQIREKDLTARDLFQLTRRAIAAARPYGTRVLVNDRLDVALSAGADGVHLPASSLLPSDVRKLTDRVGLDKFLIGVSTHCLEEALAAESGGADFIVSGPVFETLSKAAYGPPMGITRFAAICSRLSLPVLALGGISPSNFHLALEAGAAGIAGIGIFSDPAAVEENIRRILSWNG